MEANKPKISIVMPVYNAASSVSRMIESILSQTFKNWELLAVDDGSADESGRILDSYSVRDARVRVLHRANGGVSSARQLGLDNAVGEYVIHADADDFVEPEMLQSLYDKIVEENVDVAVCDYMIDSPCGIQIIHQHVGDTSEKVLRGLFHGLHGSCCNKLARRDTIIKYGVKFPKGINYCEDLLFWTQLFRHGDVTVTYLDKSFYHYCVNENPTSITHSYSKQFFQKQLEIAAFLDSMLGREYPELVDSYKMSVKCGAFENPIFARKEYLDIFPELNNRIFKTGMSKVNQICMYLSYAGFYRLGTTLYKFKNKITGRLWT